MSKYEPLWQWIKDIDADCMVLSFTEIEDTIKSPIDHLFTFKKDIIKYGYEIEKISMKERQLFLKENS